MKRHKRADGDVTRQGRTRLAGSAEKKTQKEEQNIDIAGLVLQNTESKKVDVVRTAAATTTTTSATTTRAAASERIMFGKSDEKDLGAYEQLGQNLVGPGKDEALPTSSGTVSHDFFKRCRTQFWTCLCVCVCGCFGSCGEREREEANGRVRVYALLVDSLPCIVLRCIAL